MRKHTYKCKECDETLERKEGGSSKAAPGRSGSRKRITNPSCGDCGGKTKYMFTRNS